MCKRIRAGLIHVSFRRPCLGRSCPTRRSNPHGFMVDEATGLPPLTPPWSQLTACDLNKGTILWQVPNGDALQLAARGIHGTGSRAARAGGMVVHAGGLVFIGTPDHKLRAYDEDTGKVVWRTSEGRSRGANGAAINGVPAIYELNGRQHRLAVCVGKSGGNAPASGGRPPGRRPITGVFGIYCRSPRW